MTTTPKGVVIAHADHGLGPQHTTLIDEFLINWDGSFRMGVVELPAGVPDLTCGLYGPTVGDDPVTKDEVTYEVRNGRPGPSRMINKPTRPARKMVIIAGPGQDGESIVYTAYGTNAAEPAPREWWDRSMTPEEAVESAKFWSVHALAKG